ncbi:MAG: efflux transporter outer membrane subunit [Betaproteobacteria bacterium]|nr:efflux transporter outer membrane subunit [Betaproteobacteria bacterium]
MKPLVHVRLHASSRLRAVAVTALVLLLGACAATPPMPELHASVPAAFAADQGWHPVGAAAAMPADGAWWKVFGDPELDALQDQLLRRNQTLAGQLAVYDQARAALDQARAAYAPVLSGSAGATRADSGGGAGPANQLSAQLKASWEPDLWGSVRLQVQQGRANLQASADTLRSTRLSLQANLGLSYLQLRTVDEQVRLADATVRDDLHALQLTQGRYAAGVATAADVAQARVQWLQARTTRTDLEVTRKQLLDAIAVLVGQPAPGFTLPQRPGLPQLPRIPAGVPADLLLRRPDLGAALQKVQAANAQIGIDQRAWLPTLTLGASGGSQAATLASLFSAPSLYWSLGPGLAATLFDGGLRSAQLASSRAAYRQTVAGYRLGVLQAMQQVEDNLAGQRILQHEAQQQDEVVQAADVSLRLATNQYKAGTANYLSVLSAQTTATQARNATLTLLNRRYAAAVNLIAALGGAWGDAASAPAAAQPAAH